jgi:hypothetical protein
VSHANSAAGIVGGRKQNYYKQSADVKIYTRVPGDKLQARTKRDAVNLTSAENARVLCRKL